MGGGSISICGDLEAPLVYVCVCVCVCVGGGGGGGGGVWTLHAQSNQQSTLFTNHRLWKSVL